MKYLMTITVGMCLLFRLALPSQADSEKQCHKINTVLTSDADLANFTTESVIKSGVLAGETAFTGDPISLTPIAGFAGTFSYTGDLVITTKDGSSLTTRSVGVFELFPFGLGTQFDRVDPLMGTGRFERATGFLFFDFQANEVPNGFTSTVTGVICTPKKKE